MIFRRRRGDPDIADLPGPLPLGKLRPERLHAEQVVNLQQIQMIRLQALE